MGCAAFRWGIGRGMEIVVGFFSWGLLERAVNNFGTKIIQWVHSQLTHTLENYGVNFLARFVFMVE